MQQLSAILPIMPSVLAQVETPAVQLTEETLAAADTYSLTVREQRDEVTGVAAGLFGASLVTGLWLGRRKIASHVKPLVTPAIPRTLTLPASVPANQVRDIIKPVIGFYEIRLFKNLRAMVKTIETELFRDWPARQLGQKSWDNNCVRLSRSEHFGFSVITVKPRRTFYEDGTISIRGHHMRDNKRFLEYNCHYIFDADENLLGVSVSRSTFGLETWIANLEGFGEVMHKTNVHTSLPVVYAVPGKTLPAEMETMLSLGLMPHDLDACVVFVQAYIKKQPDVSLAEEVINTLIRNAILSWIAYPRETRELLVQGWANSVNLKLGFEEKRTFERLCCTVIAQKVYKDILRELPTHLQ